MDVVVTNKPKKENNDYDERKKPHIYRLFFAIFSPGESILRAPFFLTIPSAILIFVKGYKEQDAQFILALKVIHHKWVYALCLIAFHIEMGRGVELIDEKYAKDNKDNDTKGDPKDYFIKYISS